MISLLSRFPQQPINDPYCHGEDTSLYDRALLLVKDSSRGVYLHERLQILDDLLRSLPVHRVAGLGVHFEPGIGERTRELLLFFAREEGVLLPPQ